MALDQMKVEGFEFEPISTPLYEFAGHAIPPLGQIFLPLSLGHEPWRVTKMTTFTVVDTPSVYNGIMGRPALKDFRNVTSTYHQKLKFPVGKGVGVLCGDKKVVRWCYEGIVKEEGKRAQVEGGTHYLLTGQSHRIRLVSSKDHRDTLDVAEHRLNILPNARLLVGSTTGHQYLCMLDAYQWYHQIPLAVEDQDKVGRNVEVYVDDIMVKSKDSTQLIPDLVEAFSTLRSYGLKLKPQKCISGVRDENFLGYMVTERGIEANPEKVRAIQDTVPPRGPNDGQKLTWRIAALARFILRFAHRSLAFFRNLRTAKNFE
ncbi:uncharacterized protein [Primulina eburnea]|uniref:uncharacterized protein n=1 Tax=Primulina eburnea TaxID=1245227 RepID=UPI003C6C92F3